MSAVIWIVLLALLLVVGITCLAVYLHDQSLETRARNTYNSLMRDAEATRNAILNEARRRR